jgi:hypothetical protein
MFIRKPIAFPSFGQGYKRKLVNSSSHPTAQFSLFRAKNSTTAKSLGN